MHNRENANGNATRALASAAQTWRMNALGLLQIREVPGEPIGRDVAKKLLAALVREGLWRPEAREGKR